MRTLIAALSVLFCGQAWGFDFKAPGITTGSIGTAKIASGAIDTTKLLNASVTTSAIAPGAVDSTKLVSGISLNDGVFIGTAGSLTRSTITAAGVLSLASRASVIGALGYPVASGAGSTNVALRVNNNSSPETGAVLDLGNMGGSGGWLQTSNGSDHSVNYPLMLNPNGGDVTFGGQLTTASTITAAGNASFAGTVTPKVTNKAGFDTLVGVLGALAVCSDCTYPYDVCVGTATTVSGWRATTYTGVVAASKGCGTGE